MSGMSECVIVLSLYTAFSISLSLKDLTMSTSSSSDDLPYAEDTARLESCVRELTDIVGDTVSRDDLTRVVLAADYDVNRALNFIFTS